MNREPLVVAVLGLGEAGSEIAAGLCAAGAVVRGFDPSVPAAGGVTACAGDADACRGAAVVVSLTCAHEAECALTAALPEMRTGAEAYALTDDPLTRLIRVWLANRSVWEALPGAGPTVPIPATRDDVARYLSAYGELLAELR